MKVPPLDDSFPYLLLAFHRARLVIMTSVANSLVLALESATDRSEEMMRKLAPEVDPTAFDIATEEVRSSLDLAKRLIDENGLGSE